MPCFQNCEFDKFYHAKPQHLCLGLIMLINSEKECMILFFLVRFPSLDTIYFKILLSLTCISVLGFFPRHFRITATNFARRQSNMKSGKLTRQQENVEETPSYHTSIYGEQFAKKWCECCKIEADSSIFH